MNDTLQTLRNDLRDFIGGYGHTIRGTLPAIDAPVEDLDIRQFDEITDRTSYLAWVRTYKDLARRTEREIRALKSLRRDPLEHVRGNAQMDHANLALSITQAIHLRRLAKRWSVQQRDRLRDAA